MSRPIIEAVPSDTDAKAAARLDAERDETFRGTWQDLIDHPLIDWGCDPGQFDDEGIEPPSREVVRRAICLAQEMRDQGFAPPDSIVADPSGGLVFERRDGNVSEVVYVWDDGSVEYQRFDGTRLVERRPLL